MEGKIKITISKYFQDVDVKVRDIEDLIRRVFNKINRGKNMV